MTTQSAKDRARERLEEYRRADRDTNKFCRPRIETLREQMTRCTRAIGAISSGWTGEYVTETVSGLKEEGKPTPLSSNVSVPVMRIPRALHGTRDPQTGEKHLTVLIGQIMEYEKRIERNTRLCQAIEAEIDARCDSEQALALKLRYIEGLTHSAAAKRLNYSRTAWFRLISSAIDAYSGKNGTV